MVKMTSQEKGRYICQYPDINICWHEIIGSYRETTRGFDAFDGTFVCTKCGLKNPSNPNFESEAGRVQLLKLAMEMGTEINYPSRYSGLALAMLLTNDNGLFRDEVFRWMGGEG